MADHPPIAAVPVRRAADPADAGHHPAHWSQKVLTWLTGILPLTALLGTYFGFGGNLESGQQAVLNMIIAVLIVLSAWFLFKVPSTKNQFSGLEFLVLCALLFAGYIAGVAPTTGDPGRRIVASGFTGVDRLPKPVNGVDFTVAGNLLSATPALGAKGIDLMVVVSGDLGDPIAETGLPLTGPVKIFLRERSTGAVGTTITVTP